MQIGKIIGSRVFRRVCLPHAFFQMVCRPSLPNYSLQYRVVQTSSWDVLSRFIQIDKTAGNRVYRGHSLTTRILSGGLKV